MTSGWLVLRTWVLLFAGLASAGPRQAATSPRQDPRQRPGPPGYTERVEVSRVLVDVRAVDDFGQPIQGLTALDFRARIDGRPARVESAHWVGGAPGEIPAAGLSPDAPALVPEEARGRLIVFLFQKDFEPSRLGGLMRLLIETRKFLESIGPDDRVAVLSYDTRLHVWLDFTNHLDRVRQVLEHGILFEKPKRVEPVPSPSLMVTLDIVQAGRASSMEEALALLGRALEPLPGAKSVVYVGHGFGRLLGRTLYFERAYGEARRALQAARASVFCLDVTEADSHTLDAGLQAAADDTGGFFARTHLFPDQAMRRLAGALAGHYVLFVEAPAGLPADPWHEIDVDLVGHEGTALAKRHFTSSAPSPGRR